MATTTRNTTWISGQVLTAAALNAEFNGLLGALALTNSDISASAAIATSKINTTFPSGTIVGNTDTQTLTNKTLTSPTITGATITGSTLTTATLTAPIISTISNTGTLTLPTSTDTLVGKATTDTLTNKTIDVANNTLQNLPLNNLLKNGNFINNSTNGYGSTPDNWTSSSANPVQGGFPSMTKAQLISLLGVADGDIEGLWNLNGNLNDLSSNGYNLTASVSAPTDNNDGLMGQAKTFSGTNQYADIADASCANLEISGSQTWIAYIKPDVVTGDKWIMGKSDSTPTNRHDLGLPNNEGRLQFKLSGLTTNTLVLSDVKTEANKWYIVVGIYDSANSKLKIWVNGIKKEVTASGSAGDTNSKFAIGRLGEYTAADFDGTIQNCIILSVALTDAQVQRLFAATLYKGQKARRATTDGLLYQDLPEDLVERLRGKTITLRANAYCSSTNHRIYIYDGTTTTADSPASADVWEVLSATATIGANATSIRVGIEADTTDGSMWVKEVALYEGLSVLPYDHSKDDWSRFPRLLQMDIPTVVNGYSFEENRWYTSTPVWTGYSSSPTGNARYLLTGKSVYFLWRAATTGTNNGTTLTMTLPVLPDGNTYEQFFPIGEAVNNSALLTTPALMKLTDSNVVADFYKDCSEAAWTNTGNKYIQSLACSYISK